METRTILIEGTESEVRAEHQTRMSRGFDGTVCQNLTTGAWSLEGTPADWYEEKGNSPDEGTLY